MPDLIEELAFLMLSHLPAWRERSVEQIELTDALWSARERVIETKALDQVVEQEAPGWQPALREAIGAPAGEQIARSGTFPLLIPLVSLPKDPIFDFRMSVDGNQVFRITRDDNGDLQARYMTYLVRKVDPARMLDDKLIALLSCVFSFYSGTWESFRTLYRRPNHPVRFATNLLRRADPVHPYIEARRGNEVDGDDYEDWERAVGAVSRLVRNHCLGTYRSATENPLIAIPKFHRRAPALNDQDITGVLNDLKDLLRWAQGVADRPRRENRPAREHEKAAGELILTYATYGRRWEAMAKCYVPLHRPFKIIVYERRLIRFDSPKSSRNNPFVWLWEQLFPRAHYNVSFGDAKSNHLHVRVPDQHVQLVARSCQTRKDTWQKLPTPPRIRDEAG